MHRHTRTVTFVAVLGALLAACGSRVVPLSTAQGQGLGNGNGVVPTAQATGAGTGPVGPGGVPTTGPSTVGTPILPNCHGGASDTGVTASTIKLGLVASKTGPLPGQFNSAIEAVDAYFRALNDAGGLCGRKIQLLIRDDNGDANVDYAAAKKLATEDKVFAFVGGVSAPHDEGIASVSKAYKVPDIGFPLSWQRSMSPYTFGVPGQLQRTSIGTGANGTPYLDKQFGIKQVAIFWLRESKVSVIEAWAFEATILKMSGGTVKICHEQPAGVLDNNFTNYVVSMEGACPSSNGPVAVYTTMENNANLKLAKAMQDQSYKPAVFATTFSSYLDSFISQADGATEGAFMAVPQIPFERLQQPQSAWTPGTYEAKRYLDTLHRYYPSPSPLGSFGAPGWGMAELFTEAATKCAAALTRTCLLHALDTMGPFTDHGFLAPANPRTHSIYTADLILQVRNGKFVEIKQNDKSGPKGAEDFWDAATLYDWQTYFCDPKNRSQFPDWQGKANDEDVVEC